MRWSFSSVAGSGLAFVAVAAVVAAQNRLGASILRPASEVPPFATYFAIELPVWLTWWLLVPAIDRVRRVLRPLRAGRAGVWVAGHLLAGLVLSGVGLVLVVAFRSYVYFPVASPPDFASALEVAYSTGFAVRLLIYGALAATLESVDLQREARRRALRESTLRADLAEARLESLRGRLQPHFLFNTLNAISSVMGRDVDAARTGIARLSDLLRVVLDDGAQASEVSLGEELALLERYVDLLRLRFGARLRLDLVVPGALHELAVPSLLLQPLVENAVLHGVERKRDAGRIRIEARRRADGKGDGARLELSVEDDGPGLADGWSEGLGLGLTRARLESLFGARAGLRLGAGTAGTRGTRVEVWLPCRSGDDPQEGRGR